MKAAIQYMPNLKQINDFDLDDKIQIFSELS